ncbi:MAG TPA: hypothetical protein VGE98_07345 [Thermoanaerobaculia bacterium]
MSHERTAGQLIQEIERLTGVEIKLRRTWGQRWYLEDSETGNQVALGGGKRDRLSPSEQESICRALGREHLIVDLGLGALDD